MMEGQQVAKHIRSLIASDKLVVFYKSREWEELRQEVLEDLHSECQECLKRGRYTKKVPNGQSPIR